MRPIALIGALLLVQGCSSQASVPAGEGGNWYQLATAQVASPVAPGPQDLAQGWTAPDGRQVRIVVRAPDPARGTSISLSPGAGADQWQDAFARLREAGGGTITLAAGRYAIDRSSPGGAALLLQDLDNVTIRGERATIVVGSWGDGIRIVNSRRVSIEGVTIAYGRPAVRIGRIEATPGGKRLVIPGVPTGDLRVHQISSFDPAQGRHRIDGARLLFGAQGLMLRGEAGAGFAARELDPLPVGETVVVKLSYYAGAAIRIADRDPAEPSADIILRNVKIASSSGAGIVADRMGRGLAIVDSRLGPSSGAAAVTIPFDGIHVTAAAGDLLIRGNRIHGTGDDAINLASPVQDIALHPAGEGLLASAAYFSAAGAKVALFDRELSFAGTGTVARRGPAGRDGRAIVALVPRSTERARFARPLAYLGSRYAVTDNVIGPCECHGLLAQGPNGLIRANRFEKTRYNAIRLLTSGAWNEGAGAMNVIVEDNVIRDSGGDDKRGFVWAAIGIYGELDQPEGSKPPTRVAAARVNRSITVRGNDIANVRNGCISVASAAGVAIGSNRCVAFGRDVDAARLLVEGGPMARSLQRVPAKLAYLLDWKMRGLWIDPATTEQVHVEAQSD